MTHLEKLLDNELDTLILLPLAKECGYYASILFCYLTEKQIEQYDLGDGYNRRNGVKWIPMLDEKEILQDLPIFPDVRSVRRAADTLEEAGYIKTERTGAFLDRGLGDNDGYVTGRARDKWPWWRVCRNHPDYVQGKSRISAAEAKAHGMAGAVVLAYWRKADAVPREGNFKKLSATELEKLLPMDERTIRRQLTALVDDGALVQHAKRLKLYAMPGEPTHKAILLPCHRRVLKLAA